MKNNRGFIGRIMLLIVAVIALKYFLGFDIVEWIKSPKVQGVLVPIVNFFKAIYFWLDNFVRNLVS